MQTPASRIRRSLFLTLAIAASATATSSCGSDELTGPENLTMARTRWSSRGPASYTMTIERACECPVETIGPVEVTVKNGVVTSRKYKQSHADVLEQWAFVFPAVEGLFQIVDEAMRAKTQPLETKFDASLGFPVRIVIGNPAADGPITSVTEFRAQ